MPYAKGPGWMQGRATDAKGKPLTYQPPLPNTPRVSPSTEVLRHARDMGRKIGPPPKPKTTSDRAPAGKPGTGGGLRNQSELAAHRAAYDRKVALDASRRSGTAPRNGPTVPKPPAVPRSSRPVAEPSAFVKPGGLKLRSRGGGAVGGLAAAAAAFGLDYLQRRDTEAKKAYNSPVGRAYAAAARSRAAKATPGTSRGTIPRPNK